MVGLTSCVRDRLSVKMSQDIEHNKPDEDLGDLEGLANKSYEFQEHDQHSQDHDDTGRLRVLVIVLQDILQGRVLRNNSIYFCLNTFPFNRRDHGHGQDKNSS